MKTLFLVRHAKSDWGYADLKDIDRPLNERGYADSYTISRWFKSEQKSLLPELIASSDAVRAMSTALIFARELNYPRHRIQVIEEVYEAEEAQLLKSLRKLDDQHERVMLFGHNPGFTNLVNHLCKETFLDTIPTCGMVALQFELGAWQELKARTGQLMFYKFPKDLRF